MSKIVWVELDLSNRPIRIFKSRLATAGGRWCQIIKRDPAPAVAAIRHQIFLRSKGACELCGSLVTEKSGHLHEQKTRGKGGEISLANSVFICARTHQLEHKDRAPQWSKKS